MGCLDRDLGSLTPETNEASHFDVSRKAYNLRGRIRSSPTSSVLYLHVPRSTDISKSSVPHSTVQSAQMQGMDECVQWDSYRSCRPSLSSRMPPVCRQLQRRGQIVRQTNILLSLMYLVPKSRHSQPFLRSRSYHPKSTPFFHSVGSGRRVT